VSQCVAVAEFVESHHSEAHVLLRRVGHEHDRELYAAFGQEIHGLAAVALFVNELAWRHLEWLEA